VTTVNDKTNAKRQTSSCQRGCPVTINIVIVIHYAFKEIWSYLTRDSIP